MASATRPHTNSSRSSRLNRNNTSFPLQLLEFFKGTTWGSEYDFLKYYQNVIRSFINDIDVDARGLLVYVAMGMGKSILAVAIAMDLMKERQPIVLLTKSLQENMRGAIHKYVKMRKEVDPSYPIGRFSPDELDQWIDVNFSFVSMNASNMLKQVGKAAEGRSVEEFEAVLERKLGEVLKLPSLDGKLLIVDEAHNLFRAITNGSKNALGLYDMIMKAHNLKVIFLTGTPVANDPFELVSCFNILGSKTGIPILPESYKEFNKLYVDEKNGKIKNKGRFQNRIMGLVSHVSHSSEPGKGLGRKADTERKAEFPEELPLIVENVNMDGEQYVTYQLARDKEKEEGSMRSGPFGNKGGVAHEPPSMTKPKSKAASTYRVKSRQLSNYCPPPGYREEKDPAALPADSLGSAKYRKIYANIEKHRDQLGLVYSQFVGTGGLGTFARYLQRHGWEQVGVEHPTRSSDVELVSINAATAEVETPTHSSKDSTAGTDTGDTHLSTAAPDELVTDTDDVGAHTPEHSDTATPEVTTLHSIVAGKVGAGPELPSAESILNAIESEVSKVKSAWWLGNVSGGNDDLCAEDVGSTIENAHESSDITTYFIDTSAPKERTEGGISRVSPSKRGGAGDRKHKFAIISGEVSIEDRTRIQDMYNSTENTHGGVIDLILISSTGAEGLDLKNVRHIHIMEPYWNWGRIKQIIARGVRNDSHIALPPDSKNVQPYIYLAVPPESERLSSGDFAPTTDTELYVESVTNQLIIESFNEALREVSIECLVNGELHCRVCNPSNVGLYTLDAARDIAAVDPCEDIKEEHIRAEEVVVDGVVYYFTPDKASIYDYKVFVLDPEIGGHRVLKESDKRYIAVIEAINSRPQVPAASST